MTKEELLKEVKYDNQGLVTVVVQDYHSKKVRMVGYMNSIALEKTLETKMMHYYSRSRQKLWVKGETSGHFQYLKAMSIDCDGDCLLVLIEQVSGITCHTNNQTCFYRDLTENLEMVINRENIKSNDNFLTNLEQTISLRAKNKVEGSYTNYLFDSGINKILKKVGEEACEIVIAAKDANKEETIFEIADFMYHVSVMMNTLDITWDEVSEELNKRN